MLAAWAVSSLTRGRRLDSAPLPGLGTTTWFLRCHAFEKKQSMIGCHQEVLWLLRIKLEAVDCLLLQVEDVM